MLNLSPCENIAFEAFPQQVLAVHDFLLTPTILKYNKNRKKETCYVTISILCSSDTAEIYEDRNVM